MSQHCIPGIGSIAQAKGLDGEVGESAFLAQIIQQFSIRHEMTTIEDDRVFEENTEFIVCVFFFGSLFCKCGNLYTGTRRKVVECFLEIQVLALHDKLEDVPTLVALTEATPRPRLGPDHKGRRMLVIVEWTKTGIVPARVAQFDACLRDKVNDIYFRFDLINDRHIGKIIDLIEWNRKSVLFILISSPKSPDTGVK